MVDLDPSFWIGLNFCRRQNLCSKSQMLPPLRMAMRSVGVGALVLVLSVSLSEAAVCQQNKLCMELVRSETDHFRMKCSMPGGSPSDIEWRITAPGCTGTCTIEVGRIPSILQISIRISKIGILWIRISVKNQSLGKRNHKELKTR